MKTQKNQPLIPITITDLNPDGNGVGRNIDGLVVFVPLTAPGDVCAVRIIKQTKNYLVARPEALLAPAPCRIDPDCDCYRRCGGCTLRHVTPTYEQGNKRALVQNCFSRIAKLDVEVAPLFETGEERYRNKVVYPFAMHGGEPVFGYFARHTHTVIPHDDCKVQSPHFDRIAAFVTTEIKKYRVPVWDETQNKGILRHIAMRKTADGVFSVCLIASAPFGASAQIASDLMEKFPFVSGVALNLNPTPGNVIFGEKTLTLAGDPTLTDTLCGKKFRVSPASFYQINHDVAEKLYEKAAGLAALQPGQTLLDLYCGAGTIGLSMIRPGQKLCGVEIVPDAVENAKKNAENCGRSPEDTLFVCGDASLGVRECKRKFGDPDVIVVDPPRKGLSDEVIEVLLAAAPQKIVYVSCDPATLASDCARLTAGGYSVGTAYPFNMFPRTGHVETVVLLSRNGEKL